MNAAPLSLHRLAGHALRILAREGVSVGDAARTGEAGWRARCDVGAGPALDISLAGPDIPEAVSDPIAPPDLIARERPWKGRYRLAVNAPLVVLDLYWTPGEPLRIMNFSRGDWERDLAAAASTV